MLISKFFNALSRLLPVVIGWAFGYFVLEILSAAIGDELLFPAPHLVLLRVANLMRNFEFQLHAMTTLKETGIAVLLAVLLGSPVGLLIGSYQPLRRALESPVDWLRSIPATALFPVMLLLFGIGSYTRIGIAVYGATFTVLISAMYGAASADQDRVRHWKRAGLNALQNFRHVVFWEALASVLAGARLAISSALVLVVVGEMFIGSNRGLGFLIVFYQGRYDTSGMYAVIVITGFVGFAANRLFRLTESMAAWNHRRPSAPGRFPDAANPIPNGLAARPWLSWRQNGKS